MKRINTIFLYFSQCLASVFSFSFIILLAKNISKEELGYYFYYFSISIIITAILSNPFGGWMTKNIEIKNNLKKIIATWNQIILFFLLLGLISTLFRKYEVGLILINSSLILILSLRQYYYNAVGNLIRYSILILTNIVIKILTVLILTLFNLNINWIYLLILTILSSFITFLIFLITENNDDLLVLNSFKDFDFSYLIKNKNLIINFSLATIIFTLYQYSDREVLKKVLGILAVADITVLLQFSYTLVTTIFQPIIIIFYPKIINLEIKKSISLSRKISLRIFITTFFLSIASYLKSEDYSLLFPAQFQDLVIYAPFEIFSGGLFIMSQILGIIFVRSGYEHYHLTTVVISSFIGILLVYLLGIFYGLAGVVLAHALFSLVFYILILYSTKLILSKNNERLGCL